VAVLDGAAAATLDGAAACGSAGRARGDGAKGTRWRLQHVETSRARGRAWQ
jgi:hypothetical protein